MSAYFLRVFCVQHNSGWLGLWAHVRLQIVESCVTLDCRCVFVFFVGTFSRKRANHDRVALL